MSAKRANYSPGWQGALQAPPDWQAIVRRCQADFRFFQTNCLALVDKKGKLVRMRPNRAQRVIESDLGRYLAIYYLKARQLGCSAETAAWFFWKALFNPNTRVLIAAHLRPSATEIFRKFYKTFYTNLPPWMKRLFWLRGANKHEPTSQRIEFFHGSIIVITTARSEEARSGTYDFIHMSESSRYPDFATTVAAILGTATANAQVVMETTANGPNEAYDFWEGKGAFQKAARYFKRFLAWTMDEDYVGERVGKDRYRVTIGGALAGALEDEHATGETAAGTKTSVVDFKKQPLDEWERAYKRTHKLSDARMAWVRWAVSERCVGNRNTFNQEFPITARLAFILSGLPYFAIRYIEVTGDDEPGPVTFLKPQKFYTYVMGVDVASGSPEGDWSAAVMLDVTNPRKIRDAWTLGERVTPEELAELIYPVAKEYKALVVVERNTYGAATIERLKELRYPHLYRTIVLNQTTNELREQFGYQTTEKSRARALARMYTYTKDGAYRPDCDRIKRQMTTFVYNDKGKPEAAAKKHDDFVIAPAMALMGLDEASKHRETIALRRRPRNSREVIEWEAATGVPFDTYTGAFGDDPDTPFDLGDVPASLSSLL